MRLHIIGDIHGLYDQVCELLEKLRPEPNDIICSVGDLVDKGPESHKVLDLWMGKGYDLVLGNHEYKSLNKYLKGNHFEETISQTKLTEKEYQYLSKKHFGLKYKPFNISVVHAGIPIQFRNFPELSYIDCDKKLLQFHSRVLFTRFERINLDGTIKSVYPGDEKPGDVFWAASYNGRFGMIVAGHQPFKEPKLYKHAICIDTGAVYGDKLTALSVDMTGDTQITQVQCPAFATPYESQAFSL